MQGSTSFEEITINDRNWYEENNIQLFTGETVVKVDVENKIVRTDKKRNVTYDKLIIATGSVPFVLPIPGMIKKELLPSEPLKIANKWWKQRNNIKKQLSLEEDC